MMCKITSFVMFKTWKVYFVESVRKIFILDSKISQSSKYYILEVYNKNNKIKKYLRNELT